MGLADFLWSLISWMFVAPMQDPRNLSVSPSGVAFIKVHEGWRAKAYRDSNGNATIGYGHLIVPGDGLSASSTITTAQGDQILGRDLMTAANAVRSAIKVPVTQNQFDAMASLAFNIGGGNFAKSEVARNVNARNLAAASLAFVNNWTTAGGDPMALLSRRTDERKLFDLA